MDHHVLEEKVGLFPIENSCTARTAEKKSCKGSHGEKN